MKGIQEYYDKTAAQWADKWYNDDSMLPLLKKFMAQLPEAPQVLDLCCGSGYESMRLAGLGAEVTGIDISPESIAIARERNPSLRFYTADMLDDYGFIGKMDGIACIAGLVHIAPENARRAISNMSAVLNDNGYVLLVVRDGSGYIESQSRHIIDGEEYDRAFYGYTLSDLKEHSDGILDYICEIPDEEPSPWRNYIFRKTAK